MRPSWAFVDRQEDPSHASRGEIDEARGSTPGEGIAYTEWTIPTPKGKAPYILWAQLPQVVAKCPRHAGVCNAAACVWPKYHGKTSGNDPFCQIVTSPER